MDETPVTIVIREFNRLEDEPFIYSTWRNASYYSAIDRPKQEPKIYFKTKTREIKSFFDENPHIRIACHQDTPIVIVGYAASLGTHLEMIFVKPDYRRKGIGKMLCPKWILSYTNKLTKIGKLIADKHNLLIQGDEENGNTIGTETSQESQRT